MFPNFVLRFTVLVEVLGLGFSTLLPNVMHSTTHSSCVTVTLQVVDEYVFKYEGPLTDL